MQPDPEKRIAELEAELARLRGAIEAGRIGVYHWDLEKDDIAWSEGLSTIVRRSPEEALGPRVLQLIHPEDREAAETSIRGAVERGDPIDLTFRVVGDDGVTRWIASRGRAERDEAGRATCLVGINYDVTEPYRAEQQLRESLHQLQGLIGEPAGRHFLPGADIRDMPSASISTSSPNAVNVLGVSPEHLAKAPSEMMGEVEYADLAEILKKERAAAERSKS
jgi:PAS domain S-box-containing protein